MLKTCKHTNIVRFLDTILENGKLVIIMEYAECGSLKEFLHGTNGKVKLNAAVVARLNWMHQLANVSFITPPQSVTIIVISQIKFLL